MSLNIKDAEAHELAQAIAKDTGETMTHVVVSALRDRFEALKRKKARASEVELIQIAERTASLIRSNTEDHASLLYDERGMPK